MRLRLRGSRICSLDRWHFLVIIRQRGEAKGISALYIVTAGAAPRPLWPWATNERGVLETSLVGRGELGEQDGDLKAAMITCGDINITNKNDFTHLCSCFTQPLGKRKLHIAPTSLCGTHWLSIEGRSQVWGHCLNTTTPTFLENKTKTQAKQNNKTKTTTTRRNNELCRMLVQIPGVNEVLPQWLTVILTHRSLTLYSQGRNNQSPHELLQKSHTYSRGLWWLDFAVQRWGDKGWPQNRSLLCKFKDALLMATIVFINITLLY